MSDVKKRVVITGAVGALGSAVAQAFASSGARLALIDRAADPKELLKTLGGQHSFKGGVDLSDPAQAQSAVDAAAGAVGKFHNVAHACTAFPAEALIRASMAAAMVARSW